MLYLVVHHGPGEYLTLKIPPNVRLLAVRVNSNANYFINKETTGISAGLLTNSTTSHITGL